MNKKMNACHLMRTASPLALTLAVLGAWPVLAQSADGGKVEMIEEIVVTGSLIQRPNNVSVSPITTVSPEAIKESGQVEIEAALNQLPSFTAAGTSSTGGQGQGGRASLNLRGLGSNRNLVLLNGKRLPLSDINGNVDINILPEAIIGGVDVITGGASAIYGSDAMSGVVNFKTIPYFDGVQADVQFGQDERGDVFKKSASVTLGSSIGEDRGHVLFSASYTDRPGLQGSKRSFFEFVTPSGFIGTGTYVPNASNLPTQAAINSVFTRYGVTSTVARTLNLGFNNDGSLFVQTGALNYKGPTDNGYAIVAGNVRMPVGQQVQFQNALERKTAFGSFDYEVTEGITAYGQFMYVDSLVHTESGGSLTQIGNLTTIPVTNPFIPADLRTILASRPNPNAPFTWNGRYVGIPDKNWDEQYKVSQFALGFKGDLGASWKWDLYSSYDESQHDQALHSAVVKSRVQALLNAADGGASLCAGGFNPFGISNALNISDACETYMTKTALSTEKLTQSQVQAQVSGPVVELPAGPLQVALLGSYRRNTYRFTPDSDLVTSNIEAVTGSAPARGNIGLKEIAGQVDIPLISGAEFAEELAVGAAARYSDYSTTGSVTSYEGDLRWKPIGSLMLRGSYQRAVRAPNIGELFSPPTGTQVQFGTPPASVGDPCDVRSIARTGTGGAQVRALCIAQGVPANVVDTYTFPTTATGGTIRGNLGLTPEKADTYNVGGVFTVPGDTPWISGTTISVDYYNIKIKEVISSVPGLTTLSKCYNLDGSNPTYAATNEFCQLLTRDAQGQLQDVSLPFLNLGGLETDGIDIQINWSASLSDLGADVGDPSAEIYVTPNIGWVNHYNIQTLPGSAFQDYVNTSTLGRALPRWKALTTVGYKSDAFGVGLRWRYQGAMDDVTAVTTPTNPSPGVPAYNLFDLFGNVRVSEGIDLRAGVTNLFDKGLPIVASSQNSTDVGVYDAVGRSYYVGLRARF
ncbi:TonB-dependent receptor domain-containing protein [Niveispirillum sp. KHB5.9]|uniref:TonB-dependent receptor domain-containing protein n=1 Tax=Niveispirillum sp. KHB5.9 TaxID=3400269 RepID=UPI003A897422